jgi:16S rRNA (adenine1518-N6/adenine1519-N6)-dimethyltransferase
MNWYWKAKNNTGRRMQMVRPRRSLAQHWLKSEKALKEIQQAAKLKPDDCILEIGPGTGILTRHLLPQVQSIIAVEIDADLCKYLRKEFAKAENFFLLQGDFLQLDLPLLFQENSLYPNKVVANIPYNITGPILEKLLGTIAHPNLQPYELIVLLLQKEVAQRLVAKPSSKAFGALSVRVQYLAECELISIVPATAFEPPPKVDSAIVRLTKRQIQPAPQNPQKLETLIELGFAAKRKMLRNNLQSLVERDRTSQLLEQLKINPQARAEDLSVSQWIALCNSLVDFPTTVEINDELG